MGGSFSFWRPEGEKDVAIGVGLGVLFPSLEPPRMYCTCLASWASRPPKSPLAPRSCASGTSGRGTSNEQARQPVMDCNLYKLFVLRSRTPGGAIFAQTGSQGPGAQNSVECRGPSPSPCLSGEPPSLRPNWLVMFCKKDKYSRGSLKVSKFKLFQKSRKEIHGDTEFG
ncbi:uncharacterized protein LOC106007734 isoform X3 [Heterocephalus glaber]|uniref:Uncharacterized protein LOC106007734 isoform X3 n=1 Tax=Heterocephalus glaber TaxID=10181 RepID=A0AAX6RSX9_HETGA|nr:uncharacterized protein LOC106007734 isoform X3 [Heterocephalus glaber]